VIINRYIKQILKELSEKVPSLALIADEIYAITNSDKGDVF